MASNYPKILRNAIKSIKSELSFDILMMLIKNDGMELNQMRDNLAYHTHEIENTLDDLQKGGLVAKKVGDKIGDKETGEYIITEFGLRMLNCISIASNSNVSRDEINELMEKEKLE